MEFMLWAALSLHIFAVIVWLGSLCYLSAVLYPVFEVERAEGSPLFGHLHRRFMPFLWLCLWTIGITGAALYLFSDVFLYGADRSPWLLPVHLKTALFCIIVVLSMQLRRLHADFHRDGEKRSMYSRAMGKIIRLTIFMGILSLLIAAWDGISK
jgi:uncharacterized membrane protein